jgi:hypothetical protein
VSSTSTRTVKSKSGPHQIDELSTVIGIETLEQGTDIGLVQRTNETMQRRAIGRADGLDHDST